jgi:hypothetical protein
MLAEHRASLTLKNKAGKTPLDGVNCKNSPQLVQKLQE